MKTVSGSQLLGLLANPGKAADAVERLPDTPTPAVAELPSTATSVSHQCVALIFDRYGERPKCVKIVRPNVLAISVPSVLLQAEGEKLDRFGAEPFLFKPEFLEEAHASVAVSETWIHVLLTAVEKRHAALAPSVPRNAEVANFTRAQMFEEQIRKFRLQGPEGFFDASEGRKWLIASRWHWWNQRSVIWESRRKELVAAHYPIDERNFKRLCTETLGLRYSAPRAGIGGKHR